MLIVGLKASASLKEALAVRSILIILVNLITVMVEKAAWLMESYASLLDILRLLLATLMEGMVGEIIAAIATVTTVMVEMAAK